MRKARKLEIAQLLEKVDKLLSTPKEFEQTSMRVIWEIQEDCRLFAKELRGHE